MSVKVQGRWSEGCVRQAIINWVSPTLFIFSYRAAPAPQFSIDLKEALEALATVDTVSVAFGAETTAVCQGDGSEVASVTFVTQHGDVPLLVADASLLVDDSNGGVSARFLFRMKVLLCSPALVCRVPTSRQLKIGA